MPCAGFGEQRLHRVAAPAVQTRPALAAGQAPDEAIARACFELVHDGIAHRWDHRRAAVTCRASDVLARRPGYCYAKSHLLAALLCANGVPAGLCYQRLTVTGRPSCCLHGLNAVYLWRTAGTASTQAATSPG